MVLLEVYLDVYPIKSEFSIYERKVVENGLRDYIYKVSEGFIQIPKTALLEENVNENSENNTVIVSTFCLKEDLKKAKKILLKRAKKIVDNNISTANKAKSQLNKLLKKEL